MADEKVIDIKLGEVKTPIRIDGDDNKIIYLNLSDLNIINRVKDAEKRISDIQSKALNDDNSATTDEEKMKVFYEADSEMKEVINFIFNSDIAEICCSGGTMFDPFLGKMRWEYLLDILSSLYDNNLKDELNKVNKRIAMHTQKYTKKK